MATGNAIVVGGGIGGLSAAAAMTREGWTVTVLKQAPAFGAVGAGIAEMLTPERGREILSMRRGDPH
jgi:2-polyprenyl-6-methoxyphenol hydroxylase-like FAD-dependent oxidoreductase